MALFNATLNTNNLTNSTNRESYAEATAIGVGCLILLCCCFVCCALSGKQDPDDDGLGGSMRYRRELQRARRDGYNV